MSACLYYSLVKPSATYLLIRFTAPLAVLGGKNSSEKNFDPPFIRSLILSMRQRYLLLRGNIWGEGGLDSSPLLLPLVNRSPDTRVGLQRSTEGCLSGGPAGLPCVTTGSPLQPFTMAASPGHGGGVTRVGDSVAVPLLPGIVSSITVVARLAAR